MEIPRDIDLETCLSLSHRLSAIVCHGFGPNAEKTLIQSSTGKAIVTSDAVTIAESLHLSHPISQILLNTMRRLTAIYGDGCKTFLLYVHGMLATIKHIEGKENRLQISRDLYTTVLNLYTDLHCHLLGCCNRLASHVDGADFEEICRGLLSSKVTNHFHSGLSTHLCSIIVSFLSDNKDTKLRANICLSTFKHQISEVLDNFEAVCVKSNNEPYQKSCVKRGVLLKGKRTTCLSNSQHNMPASVKFILIHSAMSTSSDRETDCDAIFSVNNSEDLTNILPYRQAQYQQFTDACKQISVRLILCTNKVPSSLQFYCSKAGIDTVEFVDDSDANRLVRLTSILPVLSVSADTPIADSVCHASQYSMVILAGIEYVHLEFDHLEDTMLCRQIVVCGPTPEMCSQVSSLVYKCLLLLHSSFQSSKLLPDKSTSKINNSNDNISECRDESKLRRIACEDNVDTCMSIVSSAADKTYASPLSGADSTMRASALSTETISLNSYVIDKTGCQEDSHSSLCSIEHDRDGELGLQNLYIGQGTSECSIDGEIGLQNLYIDQGTSIDDKLQMTNIHVNGECLNRDCASTETMVVIPAGGCFEFILAEHLDMLSKNYSVEANVPTTRFKICCDVLKSGLLHVPQKLLGSASVKPGIYPSIKQEAFQWLRSDRLPRIDCAKGALCKAHDSDAMESCNMKMAVLLAAVQAVSQLLRIDKLVSVKQINKQ